MDTIKRLLATCDCEVRYAEPLAKHATFRIGGLASIFAIPRTKQALAEVLSIAETTGVRYRVLGGMSNMLCSDAGFHGLVISTRQLTGCQRVGTHLICDAGLSLVALAHKAMQAGLSGIEPLCGIPGTVGGGIVMNAGAYGRELGSFVARAYCYHPKTGKHVTLTHGELGFGYRHSTLTERGLVCLSAELSLAVDDPISIEERMAELRQRRRESQPAYPSAGSVFRRPANGISAGKLIAEQGLAGLQIGGARISKQHAGFIVNTGGATAADVLHLMRIAREQVQKTTGYVLVPEIEYLAPDT